MRTLIPNHAYEESNNPRIITVLIEFVPSKNRVIVRGAWPQDKVKYLAPLEDGNRQNFVDVFLGLDMGWHVGFTGVTQKDLDCP